MYCAETDLGKPNNKRQGDYLMETRAILKNSSLDQAKSRQKTEALHGSGFVLRSCFVLLLGASTLA